MKKRYWRTPDLSGTLFGRLEVLSYAGSTGRRALWNTRCSCGTEKVMPADKLRRGRTKSCGCERRESARRLHTTHQMSKHPAYAVWSSMKQRCHTPEHPAYPRYGGRGIFVCLEWMTFEQFWTDMAATYASGLTLERLDNAKGYYPENCAWVSRSAQMRNTRKSRFIETPQGRLPLWKAVEISGIGQTTLLYRHAVGVPAARMFDPPNSARRFTTSSTAEPITDSPSCAQTGGCSLPTTAPRQSPATC